jgi:hypothetical protein
MKEVVDIATNVFIYRFKFPYTGGNTGQGNAGDFGNV